MTTHQPATFRIRRGGPADNVLLAELGAETFADTFGPDNTPEDLAAYLEASFGLEKQARELAEPGSVFLILEAEGVPAGFARLKQGPAPSGVGGTRPVEIVRIYARRPWLGKGVGARLMQACLDEAAAAGCDVVWLGVWERNPRAIAFYQRWGFAQVGTQAFQLGADAQTDWIMARAV
jgi:GNAT superfamily N-acetyltransferase